MTRKIQISESDLYNIIKRVLLEQEEEQKEVWVTNGEEFKSRLIDVFNGNSEKFTKVHNKHYDKIVVNGYLDLSNTPITSLPNNIEVDGSLWLRSTPIKSLPDNLKVGKDLDLKNTLIESLPDNFIVRGYLDLRHTPIKSLPDNLKVDKDLGIQFTEIKTLPDSLFVKNKIYIYFTPLNDNDELVKEYMKYYDFDRYRP
jgi:hypothetical protein